MRYFVYNFLFILLGHLGFTQQSDLNFINFTSKDGLSSNIVNAILKDKTGYIWIATDDGLNRFDGVNFKAYRNNTRDSSSIASNIIITMFQDNDDNLWLATATSLSRYDRKRDCFQNFVFKGMIPIRSLCADQKGNIWIAGFRGLMRYNYKTGDSKTYTSDPHNPTSLIASPVHVVYTDSRERLWVGTVSGLHLYQPKTDNFKRFTHHATDSSSLTEDEIRCIAEDQEGQVWIGTNNGGLSLLLSEKGVFKNYQHTNDPASLSSNRIHCIVPDRNARLWLGTEDGLNIFDIRQGTVQRVQNKSKGKFGLHGKSVRSIFIDSTNLYWVGTFQGGLHKYDQNLPFFELVESDEFTKEGPVPGVVNAFAEIENGNLYVGTSEGGLYIFEKKTERLLHKQLMPEKPSERVTVLAIEKFRDQFWIATYLNGIYVLNNANQVIKHLTKGSRPNDLPSNDIMCLGKDSKGNILIGTNGNGAFVYDAATQTFQPINDFYQIRQSPEVRINPFTRAIQVDREGNLLIGSSGDGVAEYNLQSRTVRSFTMSNTGMPIDLTHSIYVDNNNNIWVGATTGGLCMIDNSRTQFKSFSEGDGIANGMIYKILADDLGKLWLSTNKGISSFDLKTNRFKNFSYRNGLQNSTFSFGAGTRTKMGELFFGGVGGFNYFEPRKLNETRTAPPLVLTDLKIFNRNAATDLQGPLKEYISVSDGITLAYKQNFSIEFAALNYTAPEENRYFYKLEGFDKQWNSAGSNPVAMFTNIDPGEYTFLVKAASEDGSWFTEPVSVNLKVRPPFWMTIYAYLFYGICIVGLLFFLRYRGIKRLKAGFALEQERLQARRMMEEAKREADRMHEFDQSKIKFLTNLSHELRTPVSLIVGPIEQLAKQENKGDRKQQIGMIKRNARRLLNLVNQLLDLGNLEGSEHQLNPEKADIIQFVKEVAESFRDLSERKKIHFLFNSSLSEFHTLFDKDKIERILFNLLSNAFKFTADEGEIVLTIERGDAPLSGIIISVQDTGIGFSNELQEKVFDRFFQAKPNNTILNAGSGIGLAITKDFVNLHRGTISAESIEGKGSTFKVWLPLEEIPEPLENLAIQEVKNTVPTLSTEQDYTGDRELIKPKILIVEDNEDFRFYLKENLIPHFEILEASDGKEGWQKTLSLHPQLIVSDISMPGMNGIELSQKIRNDKRTMHIPIIFLTALTGDSNLLKGLLTGASDYLTKPFNFDILVVKINNLLALNRNFRETYARQFIISRPEPVAKYQSDDEKLLERIINYIEVNLNNPQLSVEDMSKHVFMSRSSLYNKLLELTGETPVEFIRSVKLNKAADMLEHTDMKIGEVAFAVGIQNATWFSKAFKTKFNVLPSEFILLKRKLTK